jgi:hypothetical protein
MVVGVEDQGKQSRPLALWPGEVCFKEDFDRVDIVRDVRLLDALDCPEITYRIYLEVRQDP